MTDNELWDRIRELILEYHKLMTGIEVTELDPRIVPKGEG